jgi:hypothetical protein
VDASTAERYTPQSQIIDKYKSGSQQAYTRHRSSVYTDKKHCVACVLAALLK